MSSTMWMALWLQISDLNFIKSNFYIAAFFVGFYGFGFANYATKEIEGTLRKISSNFSCTFFFIGLKFMKIFMLRIIEI